MRKKIVVIEDDETLRDIITSTLEEQGYEVYGLAALTTLELLISLKADCFIIDEYLPHVSGHIICILLKSKATTSSVPVLLISGMAELAGTAGLCKADAFLSKPFVMDELVATTADLINGSYAKSA